MKNKPPASYSKTAAQLMGNATIGGQRIDTMAGPQPKLVSNPCPMPQIYIPQQRLNVGMDRWPT